MRSASESASSEAELVQLTSEIIACARCPRLVAWREQVAQDKRRQFATQTYWGKPVPGFGDPHARLLIIGLAPAAHGANRTGRIFTGDRSGEWLYRALWKAGFANQAESTHRDDGLKLTDCWVSAAIRCAPPQNKPSPDEIHACASYLAREWAALRQVRTIVALGRVAYDTAWKLLQAPVPKPAFGHGLTIQFHDDGGRRLIASYHPSQQNTFTGRLSEPMFDRVFEMARTSLQAPTA
ncbi:MAG: uracil-DNA glycosylase [Vampirovibrionales bacterium]|nr:uracil-DNA glycosylase [Vampirovibrionales bacterium]